MASRDDIVAAARAYIGSPWKWHGRGRHEGLDCGGLPICVGRELRLFPWDWDIEDYATAFRANGWDWPWAVRVELHQARHGDIAMLALPHRPEIPYHVGFLAEDRAEPTLIHARLRGARQVVEEPMSLFVPPMTGAAYNLIEGAVR